MGEISWNSDRFNSIAEGVGRYVTDAGERAVRLREGASSKALISALLDLLDLHLSGADVGGSVDEHRVVLQVPDLTAEARGALGTLSKALTVHEPGLEVTVQEYSSGTWTPATIGWVVSDATEYRTWPELLSRRRNVPDLVARIVAEVGDPALRAYPMLSTEASWSIRLEGLEVARVTGTRATLKVGKDGKTGNQSLPRRTWIDATDLRDPFTTDDGTQAARLVAGFVQAWHALGEARSEHDEHALESRILRGEAPVTVDGAALDLIQVRDDVVNWGSQFPTKWGPGGSSRYLDALLRRGTTPWAIEMKVEGGGGVGQYYRHAVAQAVLYRDFIRGATPLHDWFTARELEPTTCEAAVVVPQMSNPKQMRWRERVERLCQAFGVSFVEVDPIHARRF